MHIVKVRIFDSIYKSVTRGTILFFLSLWLKNKIIPTIYTQDLKYGYNNNDVIRTHCLSEKKRRFLKYGHWGTITASRTDKGSVENRKSLMIHNVRWKGMDVRTTLMNTLITQGIENNVGNRQKADTYRYSWKHRLSLSVCLILTSYIVDLIALN